MKSLFRPFPVPLTPRQWFYLGVLQGVGAGIIDGGANFGIAYAMYHGQAEVKMWVFSKNTIAGDLGVTPIVQCLASMLITSTLVHTDIHNRGIAPLPFVYPHVEHLPDPRTLFHSRSVTRPNEKTTTQTNQGQESSDALETTKKGLVYYYLMLIRFIFEGTEKNMMLAKIPVFSWFGRLAWTAAQGAAIGVVFGFPIWCLAVVILGPIYGTGNMGDKWAPQIIKAVYGAIVGWITNPVIAVLALGSQADHHLIVVEHDLEEGQGEGAEQGETAEGVPTIHEDEEFIASPTIDRSTAMLSLGLSPSRQLSSLPVPGTPTSMSRARAGSNASRTSNRPPLVANVSQLSPLPSSSPLPPSPSPVISTRARGDSVGTSVPVPTPWTSRPRGATVSSFNSSRSYSYHLGGTGGRAQRPRAASRASVSGIPALVLPASTDEKGRMQGNSSAPQRSRRQEERNAAWDVFGRTELAPPVSPRPGHEAKGP